MTAEEVVLFQRLGVALALGLLVGVERGWETRRRAEGQRVAGFRTFGLIGLLGGLWALIAAETGVLVLAVAFAALAAVLIVSQIQFLRKDGDVGATTMVAALVTFALGALAGYGEMTLAAAGAVVVTLLLGVKPQLHGLVERLERDELMAVIKLLLMSVVLLPVLPDRGYGPWQALNPYRIWWMVVLIAGINFTGYMAIKLAGARRGVLLTGLFGGLASSTATTIGLARLAKGTTTLNRLAAAGIIIAATTMLPRMLLVAAVVAPPLALRLAGPLLLGTLTGCGAAAWLWQRARRRAAPDGVARRNPFELSVALQFGALLAVVMVLSYALQAWLGHAGLYLLGAVSGLSDVDAVTLSLGARVGEASLGAEVAAVAILLAAAVNTLVKAALAAAISGAELAWRVALGAAAILAGGALGLLLPVPEMSL